MMVDKTKVENTITVDGKEVEIAGERNLLEVIRKAGIEVPTLCYRNDLSIYGACRMCVVEIEGRGIQTSCTIKAEPGMKVGVNTAKTRRIRKMVLELLLANHDRECTTCDKSGHCDLQKLSEAYGVKEIRFKNKEKENFLPIDASNPSIIRDPNKCILCGACVRACKELQGKGVLDIANRGSKSVVTPAFNRDMKDAECVYCGQCAAVCPVGALTVKNEVDKVWDIVLDKTKTVVAQIAPAVRVAVGEEFGLEPGENSIGKIVAAMKKIGFDKVFDTSFSADLTIMEEGFELIARLNKGENLPILTSCCPAWVRHLEQKYPDMINNLSTAKSPQQMLGAVAKYVLTKEYNVEKDNLKVVSIMPCSAKKAEMGREEMDGDIDFVLTSQELIKMIKEAGIDFNSIAPEALDAPFGDFSGAGVIFGASGGVAEAAVRTAYEVITGKPLANVDIKEMRGFETLKEVSLDVDGKIVKIAVVNTLAEADRVIEKIKKGEADYQMVEVMACPGGCINGAGQPQSYSQKDTRQKRAAGLYKNDKELPLHKSHENPQIKALYDKYLDKPNSHKAHEILHTKYVDRKKTL